MSWFTTLFFAILSCSAIQQSRSQQRFNSVIQSSPGEELLIYVMFLPTPISASRMTQSGKP
jgi:hypothetical protein